MRLLACRVLVGSLALLAPQQEQEPSIAEELEALIAKTNALESFHLVYRGSNGEEGDAAKEAHMEVAYRAPWEASFTLQTPEQGMEGHTDEERFYLRQGADDEGAWRWCAIPDSVVRQTLDELFPRDGQRLGRGVAIDLKGTGGLQLAFVCGTYGRDVLLGWLRRMQHDAEHVSSAGENLLWSDGMLQLRVSRATGFPVSIVVSKDETELQLDLESAEFDGDVGPFVARPTEAERDEELGAPLRWMIAPGLLREGGFMRLESQLSAQKRSWDVRTRADWETFLRVLHTQMLRDSSEKWVAQLREGVDQTAAWARSKLAQQDTAENREALRKFLDEYERKLDDAFARSLERHVESLPEMHSNAHEPRQELFDVEREVIERLYGELVSGPIHAYFDEQLEAVLGK